MHEQHIDTSIENGVKNLGKKQTKKEKKKTSEKIDVENINTSIANAIYSSPPMKGGNSRKI